MVLHTLCATHHAHKERNLVVKYIDVYGHNKIKTQRCVVLFYHSLSGNILFYETKKCFSSFSLDIIMSDIVGKLTFVLKQ